MSRGGTLVPSAVRIGNVGQEIKLTIPADFVPATVITILSQSYLFCPYNYSESILSA